MSQEHLHPDARISDRVIAAADPFGRMVSQGIYEREDALLTMGRAARRDGCGTSGPDLRTALTWALNDCIARWELRREAAVPAIKKAIVEPIAYRVSVADIVEEAHRANEALGRPLLTHEIEQVVVNELRWALSRQRRTVGRRV